MRQRIDKNIIIIEYSHNNQIGPTTTMAQHPDVGISMRNNLDVMEALPHS